MSGWFQLLNVSGQVVELGHLLLHLGAYDVAKTKGLLIMDANVLIDLVEADRAVIRLISDCVGQVHVPIPVLQEEVEQIDASEYVELGIVPVEPSLQTANDAATPQVWPVVSRPSLSPSSPRQWFDLRNQRRPPSP